MKVKIDYSESDKFSRSILNEKLNQEECVFSGNLLDFLDLMIELKEELNLRWNKKNR